jgi:lysozyme family protein
MTYPTFASLQAGYAHLWAGLVPTAAHVPAIQAICRRLIANKTTYQRIAKTVWAKPDFWFVVALIDQMEHDASRGLCATHLHNGDSLARRTVHVPAGRPPAPATPPFSFAESAVDALRYQGLDQVAAWTPERLAYWLEVRWNGEGYLSKPGENPYLVAWSGEETPGKYIRDHDFDPAAKSGQPGALTVLKVLITLDPTVAAALAPAQPQESPMGTLAQVDAALQVFDKMLPEIDIGLHLFAPPVALALDPFIPAFHKLVQAVDIVAKDTGKPFAQVLQDVMDTLTPNKPNAPALN